MIDFPASPTIGQQFTAAGVTWTWDGAKWAASGSSVAYLPLAGGTMTGPIVLAADPAANLQPATRQYVDGGRLGDNRIINGDMRIDQRNNGASGTATGYTCDRWFYGSTQAGKITWQRGAAGPALFPFGFGYNLGVTSSSAYASIAGDNINLQQSIEADGVIDLAWGTASAQPVTLSFVVWSSLTGTFSGSIANYAGTRSYPFTYSIPIASTWTKIVIIIPGDTAGTWVLQGNAGSLTVRFDLGCGATFRGPANAWAGANYVGVTGAVSVVATNAAAFYLTGVKLEVGSVATPFNRQSMAKSLADCQRYYCAKSSSELLANNVAAATAFGYSVSFPVTMRASPTIALVNTTYTNAGGIASSLITIDGVLLYAIATAASAGGAMWRTDFTASAEL